MASKFTFTWRFYTADRGHASAVRWGVAVALLTRDEAGTRRYERAFNIIDFEVRPFPVTQIVLASGADQQRLAAAAASIAKYAAIMFASAHAVEAFVAAWGHDAAPPVALWSVGPATANALARRNWPSQLAPSADAHALGSAVANSVDEGARVLVPRAEGGRDEAILALRACDVIVDDIVAYRTVFSSADDPDVAAGLVALHNRQINVCAFFSPSQVEATLALPGAAADLVHVLRAAIGVTTAEALAARGLPAQAIAATPTASGMAAAIAAVYPTKT